MNILEEIQGKVIFPIVDDIRYHSYKLDDNYDKLDSRVQPLTREHIIRLIGHGKMVILLQLRLMICLLQKKTL